MRPATPLAPLGLLLCLVAGSRQLSITEFVVPASLEVGADAELRCRYELGAGESEEALFVKWWLTPLDANEDRVQLYQRIAGQSGVAIHHHIAIKDNDTIVLLKLKPEDTGIYECEVSNIEEVRKHQELTVFTQGSGPQLNMSIVADGDDDDLEEDVLIECKADDVAPTPDIALTINGEEYNISESVKGPDEDGLYDIVGSIALSKDIVDGAEVSCNLLYVNQNFSHQPYVDTEVYYISGALTTTETPEDATEPDATPESLQNSSGESSHYRMSCALLFTMGVFTQLPQLL